MREGSGVVGADRSSAARLTAPPPIVTGAPARAITPIAPHPEIVALRHRLGFDYGKFDYVMHEGRSTRVSCAGRATAARIRSIGSRRSATRGPPTRPRRSGGSSGAPASRRSRGACARGSARAPTCARTRARRPRGDGSCSPPASATSAVRPDPSRRPGPSHDASGGAGAPPRRLGRRHRGVDPLGGAHPDRARGPTVVALGPGSAALPRPPAGRRASRPAVLRLDHRDARRALHARCDRRRRRRRALPVLRRRGARAPALGPAPRRSAGARDRALRAHALRPLVLPRPLARRGPRYAPGARSRPSAATSGACDCSPARCRWSTSGRHTTRRASASSAATASSSSCCGSSSARRIRPFPGSTC